MEFQSRKISIEHGGEKIELSADLQRNCIYTVTQLLINDTVADEIKTNPIDGIKGCFLVLNGTLESGLRVRAEVKVNLFMRPLYTVYVNDEEVFTQKGTWGGL